MSVLEYTILACLAAGLFFLLLVIILCARYFKTSKEIKRIERRRYANKKKMRRNRRRCLKLKQEKKKSFRLMMTFIVVGLVFGLAAYGINYYLSMNLQVEDEKAVVGSYYAVRDFENELETLKLEKITEEQLKINLFALATKMASFATSKASSLNTEEGQLILNRYYRGVSQLGINTSTEINRFYHEPKLIEDYLSDIQRIKKMEKSVFTYYKVDEANLIKMK